LEICRWRSDHEQYFVGSEIDEVDAERVSTIPYRQNAAVIFVNSDQSLHAVSHRESSRVSRRLVNIMGRVSQSIPEGLFGKPQKPGISSLARQALLRYKAATGQF
jgi:hypothetical protein